jgi:hypothetical protein
VGVGFAGACAEASPGKRKNAAALIETILELSKNFWLGMLSILS